MNGLGNRQGDSAAGRKHGILSGVFSSRRGLVVWLLPALIPQTVVLAQGTPTATDEPPLVATLRDAREQAQRVRVPMNRGVIIETSLPISRVDVAGIDIVRVEAPTASQVLIQGQQYGVTQVVLWTEGGQKHVLEVTVELDLDLLNHTIKDLDPQTDAEALSMMGNVLLVGTVSSAELAEQIAHIAELYVSRLSEKAQVHNQLRVAGEQQVLLKVVVVEVSRSAARQLGINGFLAGESFKDGFLVNQIGAINPFEIIPPPGVNVTDTIPFITGNNFLTSTPTLSLGFPDLQMQLFIQAMADNTLLRVLAEPTLVAVSGETASILSGGEFPVPVPQSGAATGAITIEYKEFGVNLHFTPLVLPHQRVRIHVRPEVSVRDDSGGVVTESGFVPALTTRRAETTVEIASGATIAIAGLLSDNIRGIASRVPGLGDLPIFGALFRSVNYQRTRSELVILVTPEIVAPMSPSQVPDLPGKEVEDPDDYELYALGLLEGREKKQEQDAMEGEEMGMSWPTQWKSEPGRVALHGPWGYADPEQQ